MKRNLKLLLSIITSMVIAYGLSSCSSDGYSLDKFEVRLATVKVDGEGLANSFTLDNGETLFVASTATNYKPKNERVIINFTRLGDNYGDYDFAIKLNGYVGDVLTKDIVYVAADDQEGQAQLGSNAVKVFTMSAEISYITMRYGFNMAGKDAHTLNLVAVSEDKKQQGDEPIKLQFRHNINKDTEDYGSGDRYVSFRLKDYIEANKGRETLNFEVVWQDYKEGAQSHSLIYKMPVAIVDPPAVEQ